MMSDLDKKNARIEVLKQFLEEEPQEPFNHYALAMELMSADKPLQALEILTEMAQSFPDYLPLYYQAGKLSEALEDFDSAKRFYTSGIALAQKTGNTKTAGELKGALEMMIFENDL